MATREISKSVPGILRPFKAFVQDMGLKDGDQIVYFGCVGTCTPFVELNAVAVRGMHVEQVFVPLLDEAKAKKIQFVEDVGMQVSGGPVTLRPKLLVFMGGLAMPLMPVTKEQVRDLALKYPDAKVAGICFMSMFEKAGWLDTVEFDLMIDATLDPVVITRK